MLNAEEARARLEAIADAGWRAKADKRARKVHRRLRQVAAAVIAPDPVFTDNRSLTRHAERYVAVAAEIDSLSLPDRLELMTALHPLLGPALARWWVDAARQPYTVGWARKAFRAPRTPGLTRDRRIRTLRRIVEVVGPYPRDAAWLAAWAPHLETGIYGDHFDAGPLLAAAIDGGGVEGQAVFDTLIAVGRGDHPVGMMGRHVIVGLLRSGRPDGWDFVERLLLAAQRQEGLRQSILEAADEGHPEAFDRLIAVTLEHDLLRFAATIRAVGVWLGFRADVEHIPLAKQRLESLRRYRTDPGERRAALDGGDGWETYTALCALAMTDVVEAMAAASTVLARRPADARAAALRFTAAAQLEAGEAMAWAALDDDDLGVAWLAWEALPNLAWARPAAVPADAFERLERLARRLPDKERSLPAIGIDEGLEVSRTRVVSALVHLRDRRPLTDLLPWVPAMDPWTRQALCGAIADSGPRLSAELRETVLAMVGDRSPQVRAKAVEAMGKLRVHPTDAPVLEGLLTRKAGDLRRGVIGLLAAMPETEVVRSAERLWAGDTAQRDAACELLREVKGRPAAVEAARRFVAAAPAGSP
ncbi:MAG TPA: HEAT repeat domain-containing protein, partial [Acidimicrobiales bacterium]